MDVDDILNQYGLELDHKDLDIIRRILRQNTELESKRQGSGNTLVMKLCCGILFLSGIVEDVVIIWQAKNSSFDSDQSIDFEYLLGAGISKTKEFLLLNHEEPSKIILKEVEEYEEYEGDSYCINEFKEYIIDYYS